MQDPVNLISVFRTLRARWRIIVVTTVASLAVAVGVILTTRPEYQSQAQLFVATQQSASSDLLYLYQGGEFAQSRVQSYVDLIHSPLVLSPVISSLGLNETTAQLASKISASVPANTALINVTATASSPSQAHAIASAVTQSFRPFVANLERTDGAHVSPVRVSIANPASYPTGPSSPRKALILAVALLGGLMVAAALALIRHRLDTRLRSTDEIPSRWDLPVLAIVPEDPVLQKQRIPPLLEAGQRRGEALRYLRTNLRFMDPDKHPDRVVITSALPGEGKTTTTLGLADAVATGGVDVIAVEADLRKPTFAAYLGLSPRQGLTDALVGDLDPEDLLVPCGKSGRLWVLPAGNLPPNPSEIVGSQRMELLMDRLRKSCGLLVLDAPPVLPVSDALHLASFMSGVIFVAKLGQVKVPAIDRSLELLRQANARVFGLVANMAHSDNADYGYKYTEYSFEQQTPGQSEPTPAGRINGRPGLTSDEERSPARSL